MILGIDYGRAYVGLAISEGSLAEPKEILQIKVVGSEIKDIEKRVKEWGVKLVVVGVSEGKMAVETKEWGKKLSEMLQLPVEFVDETLSSQEVAGMTGKSRNNNEDHAKAAAVILQRYLDNKKNF